MPATNELKHFNAVKVAEKFLKANNLTLTKKTPDQGGSDLNAAMDTIQSAAEAGA